MRLGWDEHTINAPELAQRAENAGIAMITVHGRTRCQFYKGRADWQAVRAVREAIRVPLVVNGDIADRAGACEAMARSGADAVMIDRASYGAPWLAGEIAGHAPPADIAGTVQAHYEDMVSHYGVATGLRQARKHLGWYLDRYAPTAPAALKREMMTADEQGRVQDAISLAFGDGEPVRRAA